MPASANMKIAKAKASIGWVRAEPGEVGDVLDHRRRCAHAQDDGEGAERS